MSNVFAKPQPRAGAAVSSLLKPTTQPLTQLIVCPASLNATVAPRAHHMELLDAHP